MKRLLLVAAVALAACGPATYTPSAQNPAACPADYLQSRGSSCDAGSSVSCAYQGPVTGCGAGTISTYSLRCETTNEADAGLRWLQLGCL